ncbi:MULTISPECIES: hypothetical protein [unclassified Microcoleus]|uniref:hypothetical protein n=1 Tax=unclassified Microcoleus TaxID=2642155 RepID=UPI002FD15E40
MRKYRSPEYSRDTTWCGVPTSSGKKHSENPYSRPPLPSAPGDRLAASFED